MSEHVYDEPGITKKVRFQQNEKEERIVDIYISDDSLTVYENPWIEGNIPSNTQDAAKDVRQVPAVPVRPEKKNQSWVAPVSLGLLCLLLLASIIGLGVHSTKDKTNWNMERNQLRADNDNLAIEKDQLQTSYSNLTEEMDKVKSINQNLTQKNNQIQESYNELLTNYNSLTDERNQLENKRDELRNRLCEEIGPADARQRFDHSCYYVSRSRKNWKESRKDCVSRNAHLVIITSREEQEFVIRALAPNKIAWIGLNYQEDQGWKWVDETPLSTEEYWYKPHDRTAKERCVVMDNKSHKDSLEKAVW
ncbi:uncharacterized protein ACJ7VT_018526 [Polymixia lowei]